MKKSQANKNSSRMARPSRANKEWLGRLKIARLFQRAGITLHI